jgi:hypothetical protein
MADDMHCHLPSALTIVQVSGSSNLDNVFAAITVQRGDGYALPSGFTYSLSLAQINRGVSPLRIYRAVAGSLLELNDAARKTIGFDRSCK